MNSPESAWLLRGSIPDSSLAWPTSKPFFVVGGSQIKIINVHFEKLSL